MGEAEDGHADEAEHAEDAAVHKLAGDEVREGLPRPRREALEAVGEAPREEGVYAAAHETANLLLLREDVDRDDGREDDVDNPTHNRRADVGRGADDVARGAYEAVDALGERVPDVGEDLVPVDVAEIGREREVEGLEHPVGPGDEVVHVVRHLRDDRAHRLDEARENHEQQHDNHAERDEQRADYGRGAQQLPHRRAAVLAQAVEGAILEYPQRDVQHEGDGEARRHGGEDFPHPRGDAEDVAQVLHHGEEHHRKDYDKQNYPHVFPVEFQWPAPFAACSIIISIIH